MSRSLPIHLEAQEAVWRREQAGADEVEGGGAVEYPAALEIHGGEMIERNAIQKRKENIMKLSEYLHQQEVKTENLKRRKKIEIKNLKRENHALIQQVQKIEKEKSEIIGQLLKKLAEVNHTLIQQQEETEKEKSEINGQLLEKEDEIEKLEEANHTLIQQQEETEKENSEINGQLLKKEDEIEKLEEANHTLIQQQEETEKKNSEINGQLLEKEDEIEKLEEANHTLIQQQEETEKENRELYEHLHQIQDEIENLKRECHALTQQVQKSFEDIRQFEITDKNMQKQVEELHKQIETERYHWKKLSRTQKRLIAKLTDNHRKVMDEKEVLKVEKTNLIDVLKRQTDCLLRRINQLEEQLLMNTIAIQACVENGYSCGLVREAACIWGRRNGFKAADLINIIEQLTGELQSSHERQIVSEERQYQTFRAT